MLHGRYRLDQWIKRGKMNQQEAAALLEFDQTFLSQILNGHRSPGLINAIRIERVTGISVESWVPIEDGGLVEAGSGPAKKSRNDKA